MTVFKVPAAQARPPCPRAGSFRKELDLEHNEKARKVQDKFDGMVKDGTFLALKEITRKGSQRQSQQHQHTVTRGNKEPSAAEQAIAGSQFEDGALLNGTIVYTKPWYVSMIKMQWK